MTAQAEARTLETLNFDNLSLRALPVDPVEGGPVRQVEGACFSRVKPTPVKGPQLVVASPEALALLDIPASEVGEGGKKAALYFSGNKLLPGADPAAHCYCGHQFGYFSGQLGDGATMYLGEVVNGRGERWELQFKGAGKTPYSRQADGRKVLRSSLREFLCSEAMYNLGIPTTRAGTCVTSDSKVVRDIKYDGNAILERATTITRIAPTFLRFGSFEIFKPTDNFTGRRGPSAGHEAAILPVMLHHAIRTYYPAIWAAHDGDRIAAGVGAMYLDWIKEVTRRTASLVAAWQCVGWCHGVLNTDNMSIVGVTIDYGPFGFLDRYDPDFICNGSDDSGRYDYKSQPDICRWNCERLAEAVRAVLPEGRGKRAVAEVFDAVYRKCVWRGALVCTLGAGRAAVEDEGLAAALLSVMEATGADFTNTFRCLSRFPTPAPGIDPASTAAVEAGGCCDAGTLVAAAAPRVPPQNLQMLVMLSQKNPELLHQMGVSQQMLTTEMARLRHSQELAKVTDADKRAADAAKWRSWLAQYGAVLQRRAAAGADDSRRVAVMNATNPRFILRNWIAQQAIQRAEQGDFSEVARVFALLRNPFSEAPGPAAASGVSCALPVYDGLPPTWAAELCVT
eukprot:XP_001699727.1 predicted protein [Chlamydomonas reinhardtii]